MSFILTMRFLPAILIALAVAACAPARLERITEKPRHAVTSASDLHRAFDGANDPAAKRALGDWLESAPRSGGLVNGFLVRFHPGNDGIFAPGYFDRLEPASRYEVSGLNHHQTDGLGVPLVGYRENRHQQAVERWYPPEAITRAVTAVIVPGARKIPPPIVMLTMLAASPQVPSARTRPDSSGRAVMG